MTAGTRGISVADRGTTTVVTRNWFIDDHPDGKSAALLPGLRRRDRRLRTGRRDRPIARAAYLARQGTIPGPRRTHRHAPPLCPRRRLGFPGRLNALRGLCTNARATLSTCRGLDRPAPALFASAATRHSVPHRVWDRAGCHRRLSPTAGRTASRSLPLPSPHRSSVPRPADRRHIGLCQPSDPHKEGTTDERISSRR